MHITRLRLLGFKSFVEPTELVIEQGLTGVVGPNGCGKSNLLEALRWVMGETSYKSMRASSMDDVIFSGSQTRPARNSAEVTIFLDNRDRKAPAQFNEQEALEITRRIEREAGSAYRINGGDVRARDVKILFEDAATGARSPSLVRQGQIAEIVNAKPSDRRRILEDAAGIAGLHSRRHEAELRLRAAEGNLTRVRDVLGQLNSQVEALKRQARAARRYKELSAEIRSAEAIHLYLAWTQAKSQVDAEESALRDSLAGLAAATQAEAEQVRIESELGESLQPLREEEAVRGAVLQRLRIEEERLRGEEEQAQRRLAEIEARIAQLVQDEIREEEMVTEARETLERVTAELEAIQTGEDGHADAERQAKARLEELKANLQGLEARQAEMQTRVAEQRSHRRQLETAIAGQSAHVQRLEAELQRIAAQAADLSGNDDGIARSAQLSQSIEDMTAGIGSLEEEMAAAEHAAQDHSQQLHERREISTRLELRRRQLSTEIATLRKLLTLSADKEFPPVVDEIEVAAGYETALGAALGDDLVAPADERAPMHWRTIAADDAGHTLPGDAQPLSLHVKGAAALQRRLRQVGIVARDRGAELQASLRPGQRLVSIEGDLWRWDGFSASAHAPTAAAQRLAERNRLAALEADELTAVADADHARAALVEAAAALETAQLREKELRAAWRSQQSELTTARDDLQKLERATREAREKLAALAEGRARTDAALDEARKRKTSDEAALQGLPVLAEMEVALQELTASVGEARSAVTDAHTTASGLERERQMREQRRTELQRELERWTQRTRAAQDQIAAIAGRLGQARTEHSQLQDLPQAFADRRQTLLNELATAENARKSAADRLAEADAALRQSRQTLAEARELVAAAREAKARIEARLEAARSRRTEHAQMISDALGCAPEACLGAAGISSETSLPPLADVERQLQRLRTDRERLGGVNLAADDELATLSEQFNTLDAERAELEEAINKLRGGIGQLNREGRKRLLEAFESVNTHFQSLFSTLFNGGEARLELIEAEDPLESGLEIIARPPGKKPNVLSLLSGGEQTLTALSLIFAVFLTNPSPICVLDEVDAPLDDANVDRFCTMMERMAADTATRFLVITHHPMTMARMNRLFGVTMGERGVSQLVSVDLSTAERIVDEATDAA